MSRILVAFLLATVTGSLTLAQNSSHSKTKLERDSWITFTSDVGRFSVKMPEAPSSRSETIESERGPYSTHTFTASTPQSAFYVAWGEYDPSYNFYFVQPELILNRDNFVNGISGTLLTSKNLTIDGYQSLEFTAETAKRDYKGRIYMVGRRPYLVVVGTYKKENDSINVNRFFESFKVKIAE
jgi:hypothetical protein